ncbi:MAG TPA: DUF2846 domain-containing protein [Rhizomicrobium sp.]|jgi:hypothetical protein|nr:DUF2846 domain-containing protein [Rhizomicrobium sp.]
MDVRNIAIAVLLLAAMPVSQALAREEYRDAHRHEPAIPGGMGRIYFYRGAGLFSAGDTPAILVDGADTGGNSTAHDYFYVDRPAGSHTVSIGGAADQSTPVTVVAGEGVYVRTIVTGGVFGHIVPSVVDTTLAQRQIVRCLFRSPGSASDSSDTPAAVYVVPPPKNATQ